jgi:hypothetical protein
MSIKIIDKIRTSINKKKILKNWLGSHFCVDQPFEFCTNQRSKLNF